MEMVIKDLTKDEDTCFGVSGQRKSLVLKMTNTGTHKTSQKRQRDSLDSLLSKG